MSMDVKPGSLDPTTSVYVYELPVRLWHWINALAIVVLAVTGYFIGNPLPSVGGDTSAMYVMGIIRFIHFTAAYIFAIGFIGRIYWAFVGNHHSRQIFYIPFWRADYWSELFFEMRWYLFLEKRPKKYVGHNPLAQFFMFFCISLLTVFMIATGFALYSEGMGIGSWQYAIFGWVFDIFPNSQDLHTWHRVGMWVYVVFVIVHVYAAIREDIMSRQSMISTMISGDRMFKDNEE